MTGATGDFKTLTCLAISAVHECDKRTERHNYDSFYGVLQEPRAVNDALDLYRNVDHVNATTTCQALRQDEHDTKTLTDNSEILVSFSVNGIVLMR